MNECLTLSLWVLYILVLPDFLGDPYFRTLPFYCFRDDASGSSHDTTLYDTHITFISISFFIVNIHKLAHVRVLNYLIFRFSDVCEWARLVSKWSWSGSVTLDGCRHVCSEIYSWINVSVSPETHVTSVRWTERRTESTLQWLTLCVSDQNKTHLNDWYCCFHRHQCVLQTLNVLFY